MRSFQPLWALLLCVAPAALRAEAPALPSTKFYTQTVHGCSDVDLATWQHPTRPLLTSADLQLEKVQLCNDRTFPVFTVAAKYDPEGDTDSFYHPLYAKLASANGWWSYALIDTRHDVIVTVDVTKSPRAVDLQYEDFK